MIISAHQPAYNPWLGYFHKLLLSDVFVVMDDVQFEKNSFINRNKIYQKPEGLMLTIPCKMKNYTEKVIKEIEISDPLWRVKHLKSIGQVYSKSPFYDTVFPLVEHALSQESNLLVDYTNKLFLDIVDYLEIGTKIVFASELNITSKKLEYVVELTKKLNGTTFIFGKLGKDYADVGVLGKTGINPVFQDYKHPTYIQKGNDFIPYLGVLDLLFYNDKNEIENIILKENLRKEDIC